MDLTIKNDWIQYFSSHRQAGSPYLRVQPREARIVYQRLIDQRENITNGHGMINTFKQTRRDADRKKLKEETIRQLRKLEIEN